MTFHDDGYLNRKLNDLKREVQGVRGTDMTTNPLAMPQSRLLENAKRAAVDSERVVRYPMAQPAGISSTRTANPEVISMEEYRMRQNGSTSLPKATVLTANIPQIRASQASSVFDQIYQKIDAPPQRSLNKSVNSERFNRSQFDRAPAPLYDELPRYSAIDPEKHESRLITELNQKLTNEAGNNQRLAAELGVLMRTLEIERSKTANLEDQCRAELREAKAKENEVLQDLSEIERRGQEAALRLRDEEEKETQVRVNLDRVRNENNFFRGELKRLGDMTSQKILDLENSLNTAKRMNELETENFEMERTNISNSAEFVIEQMRLRFGERSSKLEELSKTTANERDKFLTQGKKLLDELRGFNAAADAKINSVMAIVKDEQSAKNEAELDELKSRMRAEEDEVNTAKKLMNDSLQRLQTAERENKNRLIQKRNENMKMKEELNNLEQQVNKLIVTFEAEEKEVQHKSQGIPKLKSEAAGIKDRVDLIGRKYEEEASNIMMGHNQDLREIEEQIASATAEESRLADQIRQLNANIGEFQNRHNGLITQLQQNLNSALNTNLPPSRDAGQQMRPKTNGGIIDGYRY